MLNVLNPGALSTVQDLGRPGQGAIGVAPSGAMDTLALRVANLCVGNQEGAPGIEFTLTGPTLGFEHDSIVTLTGSRFRSRVLSTQTGSAFERDIEVPAPWDQAFVVSAGDVLEIGKSTEGARGYLAIRGGIDVARFLGSASTQVAARIGGHVLKMGDRLTVGRTEETAMRRSKENTSPYRSPQIVRAVRGPQASSFTKRAIERFFSVGFEVSTHTDRIGIRLKGTPLQLAGTAGIDPEGVVTGAVQVPGDGQPIILCNDRPATGGYAKIAVVIAADMRLLAHAKPGDTLRFTETTVADARAAWNEQEDRLLDMIEDL